MYFKIPYATVIIVAMYISLHFFNLRNYIQNNNVKNNNYISIVDTFRALREHVLLSLKGTLDALFRVSCESGLM